jgi:hypothetical protein
MATSRGVVSLLTGQYNAQNYHYTVNEGFEQLSVMCSAVENHAQNTPIAVEAVSYIVGTSPTGDWVGHNNQVAHYYNGSWHYYTPFRGMILYSLADNQWHYYNGSTWLVA